MNPQYPALALYIAGEWLEKGSRASEPVIDPATGDVIGEVPHATPQDVEAALQAADASFKTWRLVAPVERGRILRTAAAWLRARTDELAPVVTLESGKPLADSVREITVAAEMFDWAAEEGRRAYGRIIPPRVQGMRQMATLEPVGPVAAFSGWNAPGITPSRKIAGALAAGCSIVIKPSEETPAIALAIARALEESGLPKGVLNMVFGNPGRISTQLLESPITRLVTFTGSTAIGKSLGEMAMRTLKRVTLELGGHAPVLVFGDADPQAAAAAIITAKLRNAGQICTSPTRMYVHESIYAAFVKSMGDHARAWRVGNGFDKSTQMGPLANVRRLQAIERMVADAADRGIRIEAGGKRIGDKGFFWQPTILDNFNNDCLAANVEPFGPLAMVRPFDSFDGAIAEANRLPFGLASYVFTNDIRTASRASDAIESGVVCINHCQASLPETPFGGVKDSGIGSEGGIEGLREFMQVKYVSQA
ncbi:NAD-dependent succinate-semialdehyde dehydrogenase [Noviherbaspirillum sedimenti]|uniref:NAD-dependent succinate-semialdehyde dehydrogenase n=1 Tax=Noviherbaspirillum sedimenti TaxID=2320865 RepID=A0A3A3G4K2_9BURK|nr:NAD-dependent succinate-semialdehyde dehydrogenase [Noviherbaspirillum sedimenti]RJG02595.1 NAD-dependent succinate-semialdehyde dehydrogenase [Noviherbaspirillum sedimenti]